MKGFHKPRERVLLVTRYWGDAGFHLDSLHELARLTESAEGEVVGTAHQEQKGFDPATFIGSGKVSELAGRILDEKIDLVIFDHELTPTQTRNLEDGLQARVLDRTGLILDIFARHAVTNEGKLQVEMAQLDYLLPRLVGHGRELSRLGGGIGTRGPGETKLEIDRRRAKEKMSRLKKELERLQARRRLQRKKRESVPIPLISLVGYTNAGKSSLMNCLTGAGVLVEDALFATLDPTVRRVRLPGGSYFLLADTVGFVRKLPHQLIEAFKATLQEIGEADLLLHVIDTPEPNVRDQIGTVENVLMELGFGGKPVIRVFNKMDLKPAISLSLQEGKSSFISAKTGEGISLLLEMIERFLAREASYTYGTKRS